MELRFKHYELTIQKQNSWYWDISNIQFKLFTTWRLCVSLFFKSRQLGKQNQSEDNYCQKVQHDWPCEWHHATWGHYWLKIPYFWFNFWAFSIVPGHHQANAIFRTNNPNRKISIILLIFPQRYIHCTVRDGKRWPQRPHRVC